MQLYVVPFALDFSKALSPGEIKAASSLNITVDKAVGTLDFEKFNKLLAEKSNATIADSTFCMDFRVLCIFKYHGKKTKIYINCFGDFLIDGIVYHDEAIRDFIYGYIPQYCLN